MPSRSLMRGFLFLWVITGAVLFIGSIDTMLIAAGSTAHHNPHIFVLGAVEAIAAILFIIPRTMKFGAIGLLLTIVVAFVVHLSLGQFRGDLLLYGVAVLFILIHGPLTREQLHAAIGRA